MTPFNNVDITSEQIVAFRKARASILPLIKVAQEALLEIPLREIIDPTSGITDLRRFATSEELQHITMSVFKGIISVDTKFVRDGQFPAVVARVMIMTEEGLLPLVSSTASQSASHMFGGRAVLAAESRAIRRALRELGLRAEFEIYDEEDRLMKTSLNSENKDAKCEGKVVVKPDFEGVTKDFDDDDSALDRAPKNKGKAKDNKQAVSKADAKKSPVTKVAKAQTSIKDDKADDVIKPLDVSIDYSHEDWPNKKATNYPSVLAKGIDEAKKRQGVKMNTLIFRVLGTKRFEGKKTITLRSLKTTDMETLYQFYVIEKNNFDGEL
jgi:hypothetical protein